MENSIEKPGNITIVFGDMTYDEEKEQIECPPSTVNNKKMLPKYRVPMQEGEIVTKVIPAKYEIENGKIIRFEDIRKQEELEAR